MPGTERPLPQIPRETLERFWKGDDGEEPLGPVERIDWRHPHYNRMKCREYYERHAPDERARKRHYYLVNRERILARQRARRKGRAK